MSAFAMTVIGVGAALATLVSLPTARMEGLNSPVAAVLQLLGLLALAGVGFLLVREQPQSVIAWLMLTTAMAWALSHLSLAVALHLVERAPTPASVVGWVTNWSWIPAYALSMVMLLRFPNGRLPAPPWKVAEYAVLIWAGLTATVTAVLPGELGAEALAPLRNPVGIAALAGPAGVLLPALFVALPVLVITSAAAVVVRWRRAGGRDRQALRLLAMAVAVLVVSAPLALLGNVGEILGGLAFLILPLTIAVAVLRAQLWDKDLLGRYDRLREGRAAERARIRRDLHDSLGPILGSISMRAEAAGNLARDASPLDPARLPTILESIGEAAESGLQEVRRLIDDLSPEALYDRDLQPALELALAPYQHSFPVSLVTEPTPLPPLDDVAAATAYRVIVESVRNAARHSGGSGASVCIAVTGGDLRATIADDGRGIRDAPAGMGRTGMQWRVAEHGGELVVECGPTGGTVVRVRLKGALR